MKIAWLVGLGLLIVAACGNTGVFATPKPVCSPGAQVACACAGGHEGAQACASDGLSWGVCEGCPATTTSSSSATTTATGSASGSGGTGGQGGAGSGGADGGVRVDVGGAGGAAPIDAGGCDPAACPVALCAGAACGDGGACELVPAPEGTPCVAWNVPGYCGPPSTSTPSCRQCNPLDQSTCGGAAGTVCTLGGSCRPAHCVNMIKDLGETDVDCGGALCDKCGGGRTCAADTDCESGTCALGKCAP